MDLDVSEIKFTVTNKINRFGNKSAENKFEFEQFRSNLGQLQIFSNTTPENRGDCILVLCALPDELKHAMEVFGGDESLPLKKENFKDLGISYRTIDYNNFKIVFVLQNQQGMVSAASLAARSIVRFKPKLIAMTGICAGRKKKTQLGDLIIVKQTFDYEAGKKVEEGEERKVENNRRPQMIPQNTKIVNIINNLFTSNPSEKIFKTIQKEKNFKLPRNVKFDIHFKPLASGSSVVSDGGQTFMELVHQQEDLVGIDMEAYGVAYSAQVLSTPWLVIKGVQDFANAKKAANEKKFRSFGQYASASLLRYLLDSQDFLACLDMI